MTIMCGNHNRSAPADACTPFETGDRSASQSGISKSSAIASAFFLGMMVGTIGLLTVQHYGFGDATFTKFFFAAGVQPVLGATGTSAGVHVSNVEGHHVDRASLASIHQPIPPSRSQHMSISQAKMEDPNAPVIAIDSEGARFGLADAPIPHIAVRAAPIAARSPSTMPRGSPQMVAPGVGPLVLACIIPTLLGYWKSEYGVSYAYGTAMLATGALVLASSPASMLASAHAACLILYGLRLNLFLLWRELTIPRFREFREKIEARATERGGRLARTPFILSCSALYLGMAAPLVVTRNAAALGPAAPMLVALMYVGFGIAAVGDVWKSVVKANAGSEHLVTSGPFRILRHPNYTGELLLWTSNAALALSAAVAGSTLRASAGWLAGSALGALGIVFVLMQAATSLEAKQAEKHGGKPEYEAWIARSWSGPTLAKKK